MKTKIAVKGGKREGAGRPTIDGAVDVSLVRVSVDVQTLMYYRALGQGSFSVGVRRGAKLLKKLMDGV